MADTASISAMVLTGHGGLDMLQWRTGLPRPEPGKGEVRLRLRASAVNNTDVNTRLAWYSKGDSAAEDATWSGAPLTFPHIQGIDACGIIDAVGEGVPAARIDERVLVEPCLCEAGGEALDPPWFLGSDCPGAFAEYLTVAARHAHPVQSELSDVELATFPCSYSTAENMLLRADADASDRVLVTGASGGVGSAAVQLLKARGAHVVALSQPAKAETLRAIGADRVVDRSADLVAEVGRNAFDLVIDLVGGPIFPRLLEVLRPGGRYAVAGAVAGAEVGLDLRTLYLKDLSFFGCTALDDGVFASLVRKIETGAIRPLLAATFALEDMAAAQTAFLERGHIGKIGLRISTT
jgi:NADPH:quinone reductase-like Zn-dependent oxidoreductase